MIRWTTTASLTALALSGCWKEEYAELPLQTVAFTPEAGAPPAGWVVEPIPLPGLLCPDGETARMHIVYPESAALGTDAGDTTGAPLPGTGLPAAVLYPSGSFDFVFAPDPGDPFAGAHFASPERLSVDWATRHAFSTLGMYPTQDEATTPEAGAMALALVEEGIVVMVPGNCWGDLWHNAPGLANNDFDQDFFFRNGRTTADWGTRLLADKTFAPLFNISLPVAIDDTEIYAIGLGSGGRAVAEMLALTNRDGSPTFTPTGVLIDSSYDDLRFFYDDPTVYDTTVAGLDRIHPLGADEALSGSFFATTNLPDRVGYLFSTNHPTLPVDTFVAGAERVQQAGGWVYIDESPTTTLLNGVDHLDRARQAVQYLKTGIVPPAGPGILPAAD